MPGQNTSAVSLFGTKLPRDTLFEIFHHCDPQTLGRMAQCCKVLYAALCTSLSDRNCYWESVHGKMKIYNYLAISCSSQKAFTTDINRLMLSFFIEVTLLISSIFIIILGIPIYLVFFLL